MFSRRDSDRLLILCTRMSTLKVSVYKLKGTEDPSVTLYTFELFGGPIEGHLVVMAIREF